MANIRDDQLKVTLLDIDKFVKANNIQEVSNPVLFKNSNPTPDGLLSNEIFGITSSTRANTFGYIDLHGHFLQPIIYKIWCKIDKNITSVVHGTKTFSLDRSGNLVEDPKGQTGLEFLYRNIKKIKFKRGIDSVRRDRNLKFLEDNRDNAFINKYLVIPPFYRDVKTDARKLSVGDINKLYINVLLSTKALEESKLYGFSLNEAVNGRIQDLLLEIYNWFGAGTEANPSGGIPSKYGILRQANLKKTADYGTRLVMTAPDMSVENMSDLQVDLDHALIPMTSIAANFFPFMIFNMRRFFENGLTGLTTIQTKDGGLRKIGDWRNEFSDDRLKEEIDRFIHGYSDRFRNVLIPYIDSKTNKQKYTPLYIKGFFELDLNGTKGELNRHVTWCDVIFIAAIASARDKVALITRYPIDTYFNQFPALIRVSSTTETEPMTVMGVHYDHYPKIREEDIGTNTASKFVDSINISNCYLGSIGGDYDGDMVTVKGVFTEEANEELKKQIKSNRHYIDLGCGPAIECTKEAIQSIFSLTLTFDEEHLTEPKF